MFKVWWCYTRVILYKLVVLCIFVRVFVFLVKQKTAYEVRISDWSSDVCSADLALTIGNPRSDPRESWRTRRGWPALGCTRSTVGRAVSETAQLDCQPVPCMRPRGSSVNCVGRK